MSQDQLMQKRVLIWEGTLIVQLHRLTGVVHTLTKQLTYGAINSEITGAYMDLRNIANQIEQIANEQPQ